MPSVPRLAASLRCLMADSVGELTLSRCIESSGAGWDGQGGNA